MLEELLLVTTCFLNVFCVVEPSIHTLTCLGWVLTYVLLVVLEYVNKELEESLSDFFDIFNLESLILLLFRLDYIFQSLAQFLSIVIW
jgi:hypothetical protein